MQIELAQTARDLTELFREPALTVACVLLIVAAVGWIVVTRLIVRQITRAAARSRAVSLDVVRPPKDIWSIPPPPPYAGTLTDDDLVVAVDSTFVYDFSGSGNDGDGHGGGVTSAHQTNIIRIEEPERAL